MAKPKAKKKPVQKNVHEAVAALVFPKDKAPQKLLQTVPSANHCRVLQAFLDVDFRNGHQGLADIALKHGIDCKKLIPGQFVAFVNREKNRLKLYAASGVVAYKMMEPGQTMDLRIIAEIPKVFQASGVIDYDKALKQVIEKAFKGKGRQIEE